MTTGVQERPTVDLQAAIAALADPARCQQAARVVLDELHRMAHSVLRGARDDERDDAVQRVALKLLEMARSGRASKVTGKSYVNAMLNNARISDLREKKTTREKTVPDEHLHRLGLVEPVGAQLTVESAQAELLRRLERVVETALEERPVQYREGLRRDIHQLFRLATDETTMDVELRGEGVSEATPARERKKIVDRVLKRHERARRALDDAINVLEERGTMDAEDVAEARNICRLLLRCQRSEPTDVFSIGGEKP